MSLAQLLFDPVTRFHYSCEVMPGDDGREQADNCGDAENMELSPSPHAAKELIHFNCTPPMKVGNVLHHADWGFIFTVLKIALYMQLNLDY